MKHKDIAFAAITFLLGILITTIALVGVSGTKEFPLSITNNNIPKASPFDRIDESQIHVYSDKIVIDIEDAQWASFTPTHSMEPVIGDKTNALQMVPKQESDIHIGDIISYNSEYAEGVIIHRVISIEKDDKGWYCIVKGDNNPEADPGKIRFSQIMRVVVAIIY